MKRILTTALIFVMVFSFVACASAPEFSLGVISGDTYESSFIGLGCKLPEGWRFYSDSEIKQLNQYVESSASEDYLEVMKNADVVYDMMAVNTVNNSDNMNVVLEKVGAVQLATLDIVENYESTVANIKSTYEEFGYTNIEHEISKAFVDGVEYDCLNIKADLSGQKMYQTSISLKCNGYLVSIAVTSFGTDKTADILGMLYTYEKG